MDNFTEKELFNYINTLYAENKDSCPDQNYRGITVKEIAEHFSVYRTTAIAKLYSLADKGLLTKLSTQPVSFLPAEQSKTIQKEASIDHMNKDENEPALQELDNNPFSVLIGFDGSQATQVKQAEAAVLYPPKGLHTLITGESGTGKTLFAKLMYNYGRLAKHKTEKEYPFVEFNCADYYNNPQLLMSYLFGYTKGAFTGATDASTGLVEKANHGILFLDEIHRLPPEGQELLFYLMDTGMYRKMGDTSKELSADVLIIGATTEDPNNVLLNTFKRRIPLTISLTSYRERPLAERLKIIEHLFYKEAIVTKQTFVVEATIFKALSNFEFPGNIGQLASEIKIICARSFLESQSNGKKRIRIPFKFLAKDIKNDYAKTQKSNFVFPEEPNNYNMDLIISPSDPVQYQKDQVIYEEDFNDLINEISSITRNTDSNSPQELNQAITLYYNKVLKQIDTKKINTDELYRVIEQNIVDFAIDLFGQMHKKYGIAINQKNVFVFAIHLKFLLERNKSIQKGTQAPPEHDVSIIDWIVLEVENHFHIFIPSDEKKFMQALIENMTDGVLQDYSNKGMLFILAHGNTASSIADVCNQLLNTDFVHSFNVSLSQSVEESYNLFLQYIISMDPKNGVLILADMGSLVTFGTRLTKDTGIQTHTISNVSTALALDLTHIMLNKNEHVDLTYNDYLIRSRFEPQMIDSNKNLAIISACSSGKGTSAAFKTTIEDVLRENALNSIKVFSFNNAEVSAQNSSFYQISIEYNIIAVVGNVHIDIGVPFFHISDLVLDDKRTAFIDFLKRTKAPNSSTDSMDDAVYFLSKHVMYVNPIAVKKVADDFIEKVYEDIPNITGDKSSIKFSLIIHLGFMIERAIAQKCVAFDNLDSYIADHNDAFKKVRKDISIIEDAFEIVITDDEICYIMVTLYS